MLGDMWLATSVQCTLINASFQALLGHCPGLGLLPSIASLLKMMPVTTLLSPLLSTFQVLDVSQHVPRCSTTLCHHVLIQVESSKKNSVCGCSSGLDPVKPFTWSCNEAQIAVCRSYPWRTIEKIDSLILEHSQPSFPFKFINCIRGILNHVMTYFHHLLSLCPFSDTFHL